MGGWVSWDGMRWGGRHKPGCGVEAETARAAGYDGDFAFEGEDVGEVG